MFNKVYRMSVTDNVTFSIVICRHAALALGATPMLAI